MLESSFSQKLLDVFKQALAPSRGLTQAGSDLLLLLDKPDGWRTFLPKVGPSTFTSEFAPFHTEFWDWYWHLTYLRKNNLPLDKEILTFLAVWARGNAKSSSVEWACITEGAMGLSGYVLYVSLTQSSAESHVSDIRRRLESTAIATFFPDLSEPKIGKHKNRHGWRQSFLQTQSGWAIRPIGLDVAVRGLKEDDLRPSLIVFDDIDTYGISPDTVQKNLDTIARDILGAGTQHTIQLVAQNLIAEHCAVNQIVEGRTDVLSEHIPSIHPAFKNIEIEKRIERKSGEPAYVIKHCEPIWRHFDQDAARVNLNKMGPEAFMAEYQHDFTLDRTAKVIPEYDESLHVITWSQFKKKFPDCPKEGYVPKHWQIGVGLDVGYTDNHLSGWSWIAMSAEDSDLPNSHFRFRVRTFVSKSITNQADEISAQINYTDQYGEEWNEASQYTTMKMSHEAKNERMILNREYELLFTVASFGREDGISQWRSLLRVDRTLPHPFHEDEQDPLTGEWKLGRPNYFDVVVDDELHSPRTDFGLAIARAQVLHWERVKTRLTTAGMSDDKPMKLRDDVNDSTRMILAARSLSATPLSAMQRKIKALKSKVGEDGLVLKPGVADYTGILAKRAMELQAIQAEEQEELNRAASVLKRLINPPRRR